MTYKLCFMAEAQGSSIRSSGLNCSYRVINSQISKILIRKIWINFPGTQSTIKAAGGFGSFTVRYEALKYTLLRYRGNLPIFCAFSKNTELSNH